MPESQPQHKYLVFLEWISKSGGFLLVSTYLAGFLIVSRHLSQYGVSTFSVLHLKYLVAGAWAMAPALLSFTFHKAALLFNQKAQSFWNRPRFRRTLIVSVIGNLPTVLMMAIIVVYIGKIPALTWGAGLKFFLLFVFAANFADLLWLSLTTEANLQFWYVNPGAVPLYAIVVLSILILYVQYFAMIVYPSIPYAFGGGKPLSVCFTEGQKALPYSLTADGQSHRTITYQLLDASEKSYYVISPKAKEQSIEISRDSVGGMVVLRESAK